MKVIFKKLAKLWYANCVNNTHYYYVRQGGSIVHSLVRDCDVTVIIIVVTLLFHKNMIPEVSLELQLNICLQI